MRTAKMFGAVSVVFLAAHSAVAETLIDRSSFIAAAGSLTTLDFEGIVPEGGYQYFGSLALSGVTFTGSYTNSFLPQPIPDVYVIDDGYLGGAFSSGTGAALAGGLDVPGLTGALTATFGAGVRAVGTDFTSIVATNYTVTLSNGQTLTGITPGFGKSKFIGIVSDQDIASISFQNNNGGQSILDNFSFGGGRVELAVLPAPTQAVPLPAAAWGGMALLGGMGLTRRVLRRRHDSADLA